MRLSANYLRPTSLRGFLCLFPLFLVRVNRAPCLYTSYTLPDNRPSTSIDILRPSISLLQPPIIPQSALHKRLNAPWLKLQLLTATCSDAMETPLFAEAADQLRSQILALPAKYMSRVRTALRSTSIWKARRPRSEVRIAYGKMVKQKENITPRTMAFFSWGRNNCSAMLSAIPLARNKMEKEVTVLDRQMHLRLGEHTWTERALFLTRPGV